MVQYLICWWTCLTPTLCFKDRESNYWGQSLQPDQKCNWIKLHAQGSCNECGNASYRNANDYLLKHSTEGLLRLLPQLYTSQLHYWIRLQTFVYFILKGSRERQQERCKCTQRCSGPNLRILRWIANNTEGQLICLCTNMTISV